MPNYNYDTMVIYMTRQWFALSIYYLKYLNNYYFCDIFTTFAHRKMHGSICTLYFITNQQITSFCNYFLLYTF